MFGKNYEPKYDLIEPRSDKGVLKFSPTDAVINRHKVNDEDTKKFRFKKFTEKKIKMPKII